MAYITRGRYSPTPGRIEQLGESISEFKRRQTRDRIARRGLTVDESKSAEFKERMGVVEEDGEFFLSSDDPIPKPQKVIETRLGKSGYIVTKSDGSKVVRNVVNGKVIDMEIPRGTNIITKRSGERVAQRIGVSKDFVKVTKSPLTTIREKMKVEPFTFGIKVPEGKPTPLQKKIRDEIKSKLVSSYGKDKERLRVASEGVSRFLRLDKVQKSLEALADKNKPTSKDLIRLENLLAKQRIEVSKTKDPIYKKSQLIGISVLESRINRIKRGLPTFGQETILEFTGGVAKDPIGQGIIIGAGYGIGKVIQGVAYIGKSLPKIVRVAAKYGTIGYLINKFRKDIVEEGREEIATRGTLSKTVGRNLRILTFLGVGQRIAGIPNKAERQQIAEAKRLINQLSAKDKAKVNALSKAARNQLTLVEKLEAVKGVDLRTAIGKRGSQQIVNALETVTKISKAKNLRVPKKISIKGGGGTTITFTDKGGVTVKKGKLFFKGKFDPKTRKLTITDKNVEINKPPSTFKIKPGRKTVSKGTSKVTRITKGREERVIGAAIIRKPSKITTFDRRFPSQDIVTTVSSSTTKQKVNVDGVVRSVEFFTGKPVSKPRISKPVKADKLPKKFETLVLRDDKGNIVRVDKVKTPLEFTFKQDKLKAPDVMVDKGLVAKTVTKTKSVSKPKPVVSAVPLSKAFPSSQRFIPLSTYEDVVVTPQGVPVKPQISVSKPISILKPSTKPTTKIKLIGGSKSESKPISIISGKPREKVTQKPISLQEFKPAQIQEQKPISLQKIETRKPPRLRVVKPFKPKKEIIPIPFIKFPSKPSVTKKKISKPKPQITYFTPTLSGDVRLRRKKDEELIFTGLEVRP